MSAATQLEEHGLWLGDVDTLRDEFDLILLPAFEDHRVIGTIASSVDHDKPAFPQFLRNPSGEYTAMATGLRWFAAVERAFNLMANYQPGVRFVEFLRGEENRSSFAAAGDLYCRRLADYTAVSPKPYRASDNKPFGLQGDALVSVAAFVRIDITLPDGTRVQASASAQSGSTHNQTISGNARVGTAIAGDVRTNKPLGHGNSISVGNISGSGIAIGPGAQSNIVGNVTGGVFSGNFNGSIVNLGSEITNTHQSVNNSGERRNLVRRHNELTQKLALQGLSLPEQKELISIETILDQMDK